MVLLGVIDQTADGRFPGGSGQGTLRGASDRASLRVSSYTLPPHAMSLLLRRIALLVPIVLASVACQRADASSGATATARAPVDTLPDSVLVQKVDKGRVKGPDGAMWVVMISDYQCPYCKQWHDSSMATLERDYIAPGKIRFAYLNLPLSSIHPHARNEAMGALCAGAQDRFWDYSSALFSEQASVRGMSTVYPLVHRLAKDLALDSSAFAHCLQSRAVQQLLDNDIQQAQRAGVQSTPSFIIGDFMVQGALPWTDFRRAVDTAMVMMRRKGPR